MALYFFQFGLLQPIASLFNSQLPIAIVTLLLVIYLLIINKLKIKSYVFLSFTFITLFFMLNSIFFDNTNYTIIIYFDFLLKCFSAFLIASLDVNEKDLYNAFIKLALLNFLAICTFPFFEDFFDSMNYMRFGYAMLPSAIMFIYGTFNKGFNLNWFILSIISIFLTIVYGSRGPIITFLLLIVLLFLFTNKLSPIRKYIITSFSLIFLVIAYLSIKHNVIILIIDYLNKKGINTYALNKLRMMFTQGVLEASSGRDMIYSTLLQDIKEKPIFGHGIGHIQNYLGTTSHNIFLQILVEFGVIGLSIWILIWGWVGYKYILMSHLNSDFLFKISTLLIAVSIGRLLVSSDYWLRPEYWFSLSLLINYKGKRKIGNLISENR